MLTKSTRGMAMVQGGGVRGPRVAAGSRALNVGPRERLVPTVAREWLAELKQVERPDQRKIIKLPNGQLVWAGVHAEGLEQIAQLLAVGLAVG